MADLLEAVSVWISSSFGTNLRLFPYMLAIPGLLDRKTFLRLPHMFLNRPENRIFIHRQIPALKVYGLLAVYGILYPLQLTGSREPLDGPLIQEFVF